MFRSVTVSAIISTKMKMEDSFHLRKFIIFMQFTAYFTHSVDFIVLQFELQVGSSLCEYLLLIVSSIWALNR